MTNTWLEAPPPALPEQLEACARSACRAEGANYWNRSTRAWYCAACARAINNANRCDTGKHDLCVRGTKGTQ